MRTERIVNIALLLFFVLYCYLALTYPIRPFEKNLAFKPNTLPIAVGILGVGFSLLALLFSFKQSPTTAGSSAGNIKLLALIVLIMLLYVFGLRPLGFLISTTAFLAGIAIVLGERHYLRPISIAVLASGLLWLTVDKGLGIYLAPCRLFFKASLRLVHKADCERILRNLKSC